MAGRSKSPEVFTQELMGMAGVTQHGIKTQTPPVRGCTKCPNNGRMRFKPYISHVPNVAGYVTPDERQVNVVVAGAKGPQQRFVPTPLCVLAVPFAHGSRHTDGFGLDFPDDWFWHLRHLLPLVAGLERGAPWSSHTHFGAAEGAQNQGWESQADAGSRVPHVFTRITYGRRLLGEGTAKHPRLIHTQGLDPNAILHQSRGMPSDQVLWDTWVDVKDSGPDAYGAYNEAVLALAS